MARCGSLLKEVIRLSHDAVGNVAILPTSLPEYVRQRSQKKMVVAVGLSGGVDSSVAALLLKQHGHHVVGVHMQNWSEADEFGECQGEKDLADAEAVAKQLEIPFHTVNFEREYWNNVFVPMLDGYRAGSTPNPDVACNREIKFSRLMSHVREKYGADVLATGHYANIGWAAGNAGGRALLLRGFDRTKDQSYFLSSVGEDSLKHTLFPLGTMSKADVRRVAVGAGLPTAQKRDSVGLCFVGKRKFDSFLSSYIEPTAGPFEDQSGRVVGSHQGMWNFTIGQNARISGLPERMFVVAKDPDRNAVIVAPGGENPGLYSSGLVGDNISWVNDAENAPIMPVTSAKTRYRQEDPLPCRLDADGGDMCTVEFEMPVRAITPRQIVVFYNGEVCLGCAHIARPLP